MSSSVSPWTIAAMTKATSAHYSLPSVSIIGDMGEGKLWKQFNTRMSLATTGHLADFTGVQHTHNDQIWDTAILSLPFAWSLLCFSSELALAHSLIHLRVLETEPGASHRLTMGCLSQFCPSAISFIILIQSVCFLNFCGNYRERAQLVIWWGQCRVLGKGGWLRVVRSAEVWNGPVLRVGGLIHTS